VVVCGWLYNTSSIAVFLAPPLHAHRRVSFVCVMLMERGYGCMPFPLSSTSAARVQILEYKTHPLQLTRKVLKEAVLGKRLCRPVGMTHACRLAGLSIAWRGRVLW
jgi:hypothetical protein